MKIQVHYIDPLGLTPINKDKGIYEYCLGRKDLKITLFPDESSMFKIVGTYKYAPFIEEVKHVSYINLPSLENFGQLALDGELPTSFKLLVIDRIVGVLFQKSIDRIKSN